MIGMKSLLVTPPDEKKKLLSGWSVIVQKECDDLRLEMEKRMDNYNRMKSLYDGRLYRRMRWINKLEKRLEDRKTQLKEIQNELISLESPQNTP
jgi:predicted RNase H-like nuclease (RuvC/YqgF family)